METRAYTELVQGERAALAALQRKLKAWGAKETPTVGDVETYWSTWRRLALMVERAHAEQKGERR